MIACLINGNEVIMRTWSILVSTRSESGMWRRRHSSLLSRCCSSRPLRRLLDRTVRALAPPRREAVALTLLSCQCPFKLSQPPPPQRLLPYPVGACPAQRWRATPSCSLISVHAGGRSPRAKRTRTPSRRGVSAGGDTKGVIKRACIRDAGTKTRCISYPPIR